jgi:hypothetical protein
MVTEPEKERQKEPEKEKKESEKVERVTNLGIVPPDKETLAARIESEVEAFALFRSKVKEKLKLSQVVGLELEKEQQALILALWAEFKDDLTTEYIGRKDIEREKVRAEKEKEKENEPASPNQKSFIRSLASESKSAEELASAELKKLKKAKVDELTKAEASDLITALKSLKDGGFKRADEYAGKY